MNLILKTFIAQVTQVIRRLGEKKKPYNSDNCFTQDQQSNKLPTKNEYTENQRQKSHKASLTFSHLWVATEANTPEILFTYIMLHIH